MFKLEFYDNEKTYIYPNNTLATPERIQMDYDIVNNFRTVIYTDEASEKFCMLETFNGMKSRLGISNELTDEEAIILMEEIINTPPPVDNTPTAEERIASQLELQNLLAMPDMV